ncbi:hypothetical protein SAMN05421766_1077 [Zobellia uliginosa]|uniref:Uncharacterized protein n=1 Tax=Zobellia uliginosa TaxID=143224 RepID=A0ABY1L0B6_9FLAO|nr:hypothetical protein [Zobellia uliginosa]SIT01180.1 hypothetical protein SAMN05421766_1077 [Zobellia uliginosa]
MSDGWLVGEKTGNNRILDQVDADKADEIMDAIENGEVEKILSRVDEAGNVTIKQLDSAGNVIGKWP